HIRLCNTFKENIKEVSVRFRNLYSAPKRNVPSLLTRVQLRAKLIFFIFTHDMQQERVWARSATEGYAIGRLVLDPSLPEGKVHVVTDSGEVQTHCVISSALRQVNYHHFFA